MLSSLITEGLLWGIRAGLVVTVFDSLFVLGDNMYVPPAYPVVMILFNALFWAAWGGMCGVLLWTFVRSRPAAPGNEGWHRILFFLLPFAVGYGLLGRLFVPLPPGGSASQPFDYHLSFLWVAVILGCALFFFRRQLSGRGRDRGMVTETIIIVILYQFCSNLLQCELLSVPYFKNSHFFKDILKLEWMQYLTVLYTCGVIAILGAYILIINRFQWYGRQPPAGRPGLMLGALSALAIICTAVSYQLSVRSPHTETAAGRAPAGNQQMQIRPSVILIVLDAVRTHCLSLYDNHGLPAAQNKTLEAFSHDALFFKNCIANSPWTLPSHASLFTGLYPREHGCHGNLQAQSWFGGFPTPRPLADDFLTMAEVFAGNGYRTGAVVANSACLDKGWNINQGFQTYDCRSNVGMIYMKYPFRPIVHLFCYLINLDSRFILPYRAATDITVQSLRQIDRFAQNPFFLFINYMDAHDPYCPPAPYDGYFLSAAWTQLHKLQQLVLHYAGLLPRDSWYRYLLTQYCGGIAYLDDELGRLLEQLRRKGLYDSSLIIITSDHGELFDEHGFRGHMVPMYEGVMRAPLLIKFPFSQKQGTSEGLIMLSDVYATTLSACGLPMPKTVAAQPFGNRTRAVGEFENYTIGIHRALYEGAYKYMHYERQRPPELYDTARDPLEKNNLATELPEVVLAMQEKLKEWEAAYPPRYEDSAKEAGTLSRQVLESLKALGYIK